MASLLDSILASMQAGNGATGILGGGSFYNPQSEAEDARTAAAAQLASIMGKRQPAPVTPMNPQSPAISQTDPFNYVMPGMTAPNQAAPAPMPPPQDVAPQYPITPPQGPMQPPPIPAPAPMPPAGAMPVSLPRDPQAAPAAAPTAAPSMFGGLNNYIDNNRATLMALAGGIANQGMGGFATAAPIAMQERQWQQQQQNQALAANAINQGLIAKGHDPREASAIAMASAGNPAIAHAILPELFSNKPSGEFSFGTTKIPYKIENGQAKMLLPGGTTSSLNDFIRFGQNVEAQGAAGKTAAETTAKAQAEAHQALPDTLAAADQTLKEIDAVKSHPGKSLATGFIAGAVPAIGGSQADYIARLDQLKGAATQMAISANKGGGMRLTNAEVMSLQKVAARLDRRADVNSALSDFADVIKGVRERAGVKAGVGPTPVTSAASSASDPLGIR